MKQVFHFMTCSLFSIGFGFRVHQLHKVKCWKHWIKMEKKAKEECKKMRNEAYLKSLAQKMERKRKRIRSRSKVETEMKDLIATDLKQTKRNLMYAFLSRFKSTCSFPTTFLFLLFFSSYLFALHHYKFTANIISWDNRTRECFYHKFIFYRQLFSFCLSNNGNLWIKLS